MKLAIYGGSFNPPHNGHVAAAMTVLRELNPDKLMIIPASIPPHKELTAGSPTPGERLILAQLAFADLPNTEVSDMEIVREGRSYSADTVEAIKKQYPDAELSVAVGTDMLLSFETWYRFRYLLDNTTLAVFIRNDGEEAEVLAYADHLRSEYGAEIRFLRHDPLPMSSTDVREMLSRRMGASYLPEKVYERIIAAGDYDARPELYWLREKVLEYLKPSRVAHVAGCETEAVSLAQHWVEDPENAAEAAILHDITKKLLLSEQLILCEEYGIINDNVESENVKLLHAKTGAEMARRLFNVSDEVYNAIRWHTTGKPDMTLLEKIIYIADYIEPNRDFDGVDKLRELAYEDIDEAMLLGLRMSLEDITSSGITPHPATVKAYDWYRSCTGKN